MRKNRIAVLASGFLVSAIVIACVGGPGSLPGTNDENPDVEKSGTGKSGSGNQTGSGQGGGTGGSNPGTAIPPGTATVVPPSKPPTNTKTISGSEFSRTCLADSDCISVFQGLVCTQCKCPNTAIAKTDETKYSTTLEQRRADPACPAQTDVECAPCSSSLVAVCSANKQCAMGLPKKPDGG